MSKLLLSQEVADILRVKTQTLAAWRLYGRGPRFLKISGAVRYRLEDVELYLKEAVRESTSDTGEKA